jgi:hypothetical protein
MVEIWKADIFPALDPLIKAVLLHDFQASPAFGPGDWERASPAVCVNGLAAVALRMIRESGGNIPTAVLQQLRTSAFEVSARNLKIVAAGQEALDRLDAAAIDYVITKGPGLAAASRHAHERPYSDLDIVVSKERFEPARALFEGLGYVESGSSRQSWAALDRIAREAVNLRDGRGGSVDLHHHIPPWIWGRTLTFDRLRRAAVRVDVGGTSLWCASAEGNFIVVALHLVSDRNRPGATLMIWRDLLVLAEVCRPEILQRLARDLGLTGWLQWVLTRFPAEIYAAHLRHLLEPQVHRQPIPAARRLRLLLPPHIGSKHLVSQPLRLPAWRGALYCLGGIVPSRSFLLAQGLEPDGGRRYLTWWKRGGTLIWQALRS